MSHDAQQRRLSRATVLTVGATIVVGLIVLAVAYQTLLAGPDGRPSSGAPDDAANGTAAASGSGDAADGVAANVPAVSEARPAPGDGVVVGRLIDAESGLPVSDVGVVLKDRGRRTLTGPDGRFRLDAVEPGRLTLVAGVADELIPATVTLDLGPGGADAGLMAVQPAAPPTLIDPEFGGVVPSCGATELALRTTSLDAPTPLRATCVAAQAVPAAPPAGRLPLAVVDLAPSDVALRHPAQLTVDLPAQPRYAEGIALDLLRLDPETFGWTTAGEIVVAAGGETASGTVEQLGTYLVAAPPYGTFESTVDGPAIGRFSIAGTPDGSPQDVYPVGTNLVFASFDYAATSNTPIMVRTVDTDGDVVYESQRPYTDSGTDSVPMARPTGPWPPGRYRTTLYIGTPAAPFDSLSWRVAAAPTPTPTPLAPPPILQRADAAPTLPPPVAVRPPANCTPPASWWPKTVQAGDTLAALARRTGTDVVTLRRANCLTTDLLRAGQLIYVPSVPKKPVTEYATPAKKPSYPTYVPPSDPGTGPTAVPTSAGVPATARPWKPTPPPATLVPTPYRPVAPPTAIPTQAPPPTSDLPPAAAPPTAVPSPTSDYVKPTDRAEPTLAPRPTAP